MIINGTWYEEPEAQAYINSLLARNEELESKHELECMQIAHYSDELAKAKELLKAAVVDFVYLGKQFCDKHCKPCPLDMKHYCEWKHHNEALALIGEEGEQNG